MRNRQLDRYSLKWNPFTPDIPTEACLVTGETERFLWRVEQLAKIGGFALLSGESGTGKSVVLRLLRDHLGKTPDLLVAVLSRPQGSIPDFYRELGALFDVQLTPHNRWAGSKMLRERWLAHMESSLFRAVLIVDEAQEMHSSVLSELRLLCSDQLDSRSILTVVLSGDDRLPELFRTRELIPLGTRIRVRMNMGAMHPTQLKEHLRHVLSVSGNPDLMTEELSDTLCERSVGNLRILMGMGAELLEAAIQRQIDRIDEKLFLDTFAPQITLKNKSKPVPAARSR
ncbi:MAG: AAA family ATPase [Magnetococcales bacterium]|nr:AAA family ATPase [Magnetococcales bacterium]